MYRNVQQRFANTLEEIREAGLFKTERVIVSPQGAHIGVIPPGASTPREVLNFCANNYLGPERPPPVIEAAHAAIRLARLRPVVGALHLRHPGCAQRAGAPPRRLRGHRGLHPLPLGLRRQRRPLRDPARRRGRGHLRRAQPRLDHRRHPAVQGRPPPLPQRRHGRARRAPEGHPGQAHAAHRDRRGLLDGRLPREARRHLRPRGPVRRAGDDRRVPRHGLHRRRPAAAPPSTSG